MSINLNLAEIVKKIEAGLGESNVKALSWGERKVLFAVAQELIAGKNVEDICASKSISTKSEVVQSLKDKICNDTPSEQTKINPILKSIRSFFKNLGNIIHVRISSTKILDTAKTIQTKAALAARDATTSSTTLPSPATQPAKAASAAASISAVTTGPIQSTDEEASAAQDEADFALALQLAAEQFDDLPPDDLHNTSTAPTATNAPPPQPLKKPQDNKKLTELQSEIGELPTTLEGLCDLLKKNPALINTKIDWTFPSGSHRYEDRDKVMKRESLHVSNVYLSHLLCAGCLADANKTAELLQQVLPHINLESIDESNLFSYVGFHQSSGNNVLKTAIAAASGSISGTSERRTAVELLLGAMENWPDKEKGKCKGILDAGDNFPLGGHTAAEFLTRQGNEDLALRALRLGASATPDLLKSAAASMGTTEHGTALIEEVLQRFLNEKLTLTAEEYDWVKDGLSSYTIHAIDPKWYNENFGNIDTIKPNHISWVWDALRVFKRGRNLGEGPNNNAELKAACTRLKIDTEKDWPTIINIIIRQKALNPISYTSEHNGIAYFTDQYRPHNADSVTKRSNWSKVPENEKLVEGYLEVLKKIPVEPK